MLIFTIIMGLLVFIVLYVTISSSAEVPAILGTCLVCSLIFIWVLVFLEYKRHEDLRQEASRILMIVPESGLPGTYSIKPCDHSLSYMYFRGQRFEIRHWCCKMQFLRSF